MKVIEINNLFVRAQGAEESPIRKTELTVRMYKYFKISSLGRRDLGRTRIMIVTVTKV